MIKKILLIIISFSILLAISFIAINKFHAVREFKRTASKITVNISKTFKIKEIKSHYSKLVKTDKITKLYKKIDGKFKECGYLGPNVELELDKINIDETTQLFKVKSLDEEYYVNYKYLSKIDKLSEYDDRYKNYIPFDENIITDNDTSFYDSDNKLVYSFNKSFNLPILVKDDKFYHVIYNNRLLKIKKTDVVNTVYNYNSSVEKETAIPTILYHFIYDENKEKCDEIICHKMSEVQKNIDMLKRNNYFSVTMDEFEKFIDGNINLPKNSILITIDDGGFAYNAKKIFTENKINATLFVVSSWFNPHEFESEYLEVHSHSDNLHITGVCPMGEQGGPIQCLDRSTLLADLKTSREKTNNTIAFSYPFYDYNEYSISVLKEAGFRLGFGGLYAGGYYQTHVGYDKFRIPRITILSSTTTKDLEDAIR